MTPRLRFPGRVALLAVWLLAWPAGAATVERGDDGIVVDFGDDGIVVDFGDGVVLRFAQREGYFFGLNRVSVGGVELSSPETCLRPCLAEEFDLPGPPAGRMSWPLARLTAVRAEGERVEIDLQLLGTTDPRALRRLFVFAGDRDRALAPENVTPELADLKAKAESAEAAFTKAFATDADHAAAADALREAERALKSAESPRDRQRAQRDARRANRKLQEVVARLRPVLAARSADLRRAQEVIDAFEAALDERALELGSIHRDFYRFAHTRLPAEFCTRRFLAAQVADLAAACGPAGTLTWVLEPERRNVAGWTWVGWRQHYRFRLPKGRRVNVLRQLGTWELGGRPDGLTVVNLRYRGLGRIEQPLASAGGGEGVREAFSTTEIMPGAVGGSYLVSPQVPASEDEVLTDRGYALKHRAGAWIARMARGAGHGFVDFQYRPEAALAAFPLRQGGLRALTEAFPGDAYLSQTDEEFFAATEAHETVPMVYLALVTRRGRLTTAESRTRWQEIDQHVRDAVSEELGFVQHEALPGIGILSDAGWAGYYKALAEGGLDGWADKGVRLVAYHNPGWINGRYQGPDGPPDTGGGVCNIYDWWPTKDVVEPWQAFQRACARRGVAFYPWLGQTLWRDAPFVERLGLDREHWSLNTPFDEHGPGYGAENMKGNIHDPRFREVFLGQLERLRGQCGYQGFWADSFQNLFMSQLDWARDGGASMQRAWWEQIAAWSRVGVGWMAESHAFPGLSCSIEVHGWEDQPWFFRHVWKWHRGGAQNAYSGEALDRIGFRVMANKGWTAPDHSYKTHTDFAIPSFKRLAQEYLAALPTMRRSYVLPDSAGMLWLGYGGDEEGVYFAFDARPVPKGVRASYVLDRKDTPVAEAEAERTYRVTADDLLERFGVRRGPERDPRIGRTYDPPAYTWPNWGVTEGAEL